MSARSKNQFKPNYVAPPGAILQEWLEEQELTQSELADRMGRHKKTINEIVKGIAPITAETALQLENVTGIEAGFWNNAESRYREHLAREEENDRLRTQTARLSSFSYGPMAKLGWVADVTDRVERVRNLLRFFKVASFDQWEATWACVEGKARESTAYKSKLGDLSAWLRQGEIEAARITCQPYDAKRFREVLTEIRQLTTAPVPEQARRLPALCASAGVAFVLVPEIRHTHVSGFTRWLTPEKALIQQSLRHKRNDHLWFTFFHEAAHILLHGKKERFVEIKGLDDPREAEANRWAGDFLIPPHEWRKLRSIYETDPSDQTILDFARSLGIAPGIIAGRIQRETGSFSRHHDLFERLELKPTTPKKGAA